MKRQPLLDTKLHCSIIYIYRKIYFKKYFLNNYNRLLIKNFLNFSLIPKILFLVTFPYGFLMNCIWRKLYFTELRNGSCEIEGRGKKTISVSPSITFNSWKNSVFHFKSQTLIICSNLAVYQIFIAVLCGLE